MEQRKLWDQDRELIFVVRQALFGVILQMQVYFHSVSIIARIWSLLSVRWVTGCALPEMFRQSK